MTDSLPLGMTKVPLGWPMMAQAYIDFALFAIGHSDFLESFEADTGIRYVPPKGGLERMIDESTGATKAVVSQFLDWLTVNRWGEESRD